MSLENLLENKIISKLNKKQEPNFEIAEQDLKNANSVFLSGIFDWTLNIAYNSVLLASRELMFFLGYRPIGKEHHKAVFEFLREINFDFELIDFFDEIRKKRNKNVYGDREETSEEMADEILQKAEEFVQKIRTFVQKIRTGGLNEI